MAMWETKNKGYWNNYKYEDDRLSHGDVNNKLEKELMTHQT